MGGALGEQANKSIHCAKRHYGTQTSRLSREYELPLNLLYMLLLKIHVVECLRAQHVVPLALRLTYTHS